MPSSVLCRFSRLLVLFFVPESILSILIISGTDDIVQMKQVVRAELVKDPRSELLILTLVVPAAEATSASHRVTYPIPELTNEATVLQITRT